MPCPRWTPRFILKVLPVHTQIGHNELRCTSGYTSISSVSVKAHYQPLEAGKELPSPISPGVG